jgi:hypothetical protein
MRASTAYFVGGATIIAAIAIGLGGGIVAGNIMNPVTPKVGADAGKAGQQTAATTSSTEHMTTGSAASQRVQYLPGTMAFDAATVPAQAESQAKPAAASPTTSASNEPQTPPTAAASETAGTAPAAASVRSVDRSPDKALDKPKGKQAAVEPKAESKAEKADSKTEAKMEAKAEAKPTDSEQATQPENAFAKARDSDVKRASSERRRADRRRDWTERRRREARDYREARDPREMRDRTDWDDVARSVREDSDARDFASSRRGYNPPPDRGFPRIDLFGPDDD